MQERAEALELYGAENRKRKLIHNKLLELQGTHMYMSISIIRYGSSSRRGCCIHPCCVLLSAHLCREHPRAVPCAPRAAGRGERLYVYKSS